MKVTIITATYNSVDTIEDTIRSVAMQTYADIEHIVIDGAGTDKTLEVVEQLRPLYTDGKVLKIFSEPDNGIYDALNKGLKYAGGDVIGFLNSDDFFSSLHSLSRLMKGFDTDTDAVYADLHYVLPRDTDRIVRYFSSRAFSRRRMLMGFQPAHPTFYCRKECYDRFGGFDTDFKVAADFEQLLRMIYVGGIRTRYVPIDCVTMRMGGASTKWRKSHRQIFNDHMRAYHKNRVRANRFTDCLRYFWKLGEMAAARVLWNRQFMLEDE